MRSCSALQRTVCGDCIRRRRVCPGPYRFLPTRGGEAPVRVSPGRRPPTSALGDAGVPDHIMVQGLGVCFAFSEKPKITDFPDSA